MLGFHGIRYSLKKPEIFKAELNALKRIAKEGKEIGLLLPQVISLTDIQETKKILKEINAENLKVGVMVETPAAVQIIKDLCEEGIDFISFGTNDLTQYILAVDRGNEQVQYLYNEMNPAILYQLGFVIRVCKRFNVETSICGQSGSKKEMAKFLIEQGITSISVNADKAKEISDYIAEVEKELVAGTDKEPRKYEENKREQIKESVNEEVGEENNNFEEPITPATPEQVEEDIKIIEAEKKEYIKSHPEEEQKSKSVVEEKPKKEEILDIF